MIAILSPHCAERRWQNIANELGVGNIWRPEFVQISKGRFDRPARHPMETLAPAEGWARGGGTPREVGRGGKTRRQEVNAAGSRPMSGAKRRAAQATGRDPMPGRQPRRRHCGSPQGAGSWPLGPPGGQPGQRQREPQEPLRTGDGVRGTGRTAIGGSARSAFARDQPMSTKLGRSSAKLRAQVGPSLGQLRVDFDRHWAEVGNIGPKSAKFGLNPTKVGLRPSRKTWTGFDARGVPYSTDLGRCATPGAEEYADGKVARRRPRALRSVSLRAPFRSSPASSSNIGCFGRWGGISVNVLALDFVRGPRVGLLLCGGSPAACL